MGYSGGTVHSAAVMDVLNAALGAADPYLAVERAFEAHPLSDSGRIYVVGAGKAGAAMSRAAEDALGERIAGGLVIVKDGHLGEPSRRPQRIRIVEAAHPVPDSRGERATARLLQIADAAGPGDTLVCLISGGGSALLVSPAEGITLADIQATTALLLRSGATIGELNAVRKHLSAVAGGQLARRAAPARVVSLILSDVVGSPLDAIASGPTAPDPTTYAEALAICRRYSLLAEIPAFVLDRLEKGEAGELEETPKPGDPLFSSVTNRVVASNVTAVEAAASRARRMGLNTAIVSTFIEGEAREVGRALAGVAREMAAYNRPLTRPACLLFGGETTVTLQGSGTGGRNSELALAAAVALRGCGQDVLLAAFATDGGDGSCPGAGAMADGTTIERGESKGLDAQAALHNNDSYSYWEALGDAILTGPTGTNVNDVIALFAF